MDAFCDLQYVLSGAILEFGLHNVFGSAFTEVHRSNMSKMCKSLEEAQRTIDKCSAENVPAYSVQKGNLWMVKRVSDNKTIKSIDYSPADLSKCFKNSPVS